MERIKIFVQKIQELYYSKHPKTAIDIDLMLDYTRVMYIDLLEWRKEFATPVHSDITTILQEHSNAPETNAAVLAPTTPPVRDANGNQHEDDHQQEPGKKATSEVSADTEAITGSNEIPELPSESTAPKQEQQEPEVVREFPEEESLATLSQEQTGISYEAPAVVEKPVEIQDTLVEETPVKNHTVEIPAPPPAEIPLPEKKAFEPTRLFDHVAETKDIRSAIGINDKYLFLNELFNNHKSNYEETLDKLNQTKTKEEALDWVKTKVAKPAHWDDNDGTVQSFYALLEKHFSAR